MPDMPFMGSASGVKGPSGMAGLDLVRDNWRKYEGALDGQLTSSARTVFDISVVNLEENASRTPVNYVMPPEIERVVDASNPQLRELNEQALALKVIDLPENDSRAVYKMFGKDLLRYKTLKMDVHAEAVEGYPLQDDELTLFLHISSNSPECASEIPQTFLAYSITDRKSVV